MIDIATFITNYFIVFILVLSFLVFVHELGHYLVAKYFGVKIEVFSIGFGPELWGWNDRSGTRWRIAAIPLGGYVKMFGDADATSRPGAAVRETEKQEKETGNWAEGKIRPLSPEEKAVSFHYKPLSQKAWIVAAGPLSNFLTAIVLVTVLLILYGRPTTPPVIGDVLAGSAAEEAGLQKGDRILEINGQTIERFEDILVEVQLNQTQIMQLKVKRGEQILLLDARPQMTQSKDAFGNSIVTPLLGVRSTSETEFHEFNLVTGFGQAVEDIYVMAKTNLTGLFQIISFERSPKDLRGLPGMSEMVGQAAEIGISSLIWLTAMLSLNLGLVNLFPIPMLDGGHLLFYTIEAIIRRPLSVRFQEIAFRIGFSFMIFLFVFVTWNDIDRLINKLFSIT